MRMATFNISNVYCGWSALQAFSNQMFFTGRKEPDSLQSPHLEQFKTSTLKSQLQGLCRSEQGCQQHTQLLSKPSKCFRRGPSERLKYFRRGPSEILNRVVTTLLVMT